MFWSLWVWRGLGSRSCSCPRLHDCHFPYLLSRFSTADVQQVTLRCLRKTLSLLSFLRVAELFLSMDLGSFQPLFLKNIFSVPFSLSPLPLRLQCLYMECFYNSDPLVLEASCTDFFNFWPFSSSEK